MALRGETWLGIGLFALDAETLVHAAVGRLEEAVIDLTHVGIAVLAASLVGLGDLIRRQVLTAVVQPGSGASRIYWCRTIQISRLRVRVSLKRANNTTSVMAPAASLKRKQTRSF